MVKKSKLLLALDAHKGRDYEAEKQKKLIKAAEKRKAKKAKLEAEKREKEGKDEKADQQPDVEVSKDDKKKDEKKEKRQDAKKKEDVEVNGEAEGESTDESGSSGSEEEGSDDDGDEKPKENRHKDEENDEDKNENEEKGSDSEEENEEEESNEEENDGEEEEDIPLSDLSGDERTDVIPHQRLTINNSAAITASIKRISFITPKTPFSEHNSLVSTEPIDVPDPNDDLNRELAFYRVCQVAAVDARTLLKKEGIPFSRPGDYFAEMVKSDEHMNKIKQKLYEEAAAKKAAAEARRQRDLKKFGKQVQIAKLQQRQKEKRETLEKINALKRKRKADKSGPTEEEDPFDVAIEEASKAEQSRKRRRGDSGGGPSAKRQKKNEKFGFGGKKRFKKSGDAISSGDLSGFSAKKMKAGATGAAKKRPGKSRRKKMKLSA